MGQKKFGAKNLFGGFKGSLIIFPQGIWEFKGLFLNFVKGPLKKKERGGAFNFLPKKGGFPQIIFGDRKGFPPKFYFFIFNFFGGGGPQGEKGGETPQGEFFLKQERVFKSSLSLKGGAIFGV